MLHIFFGKTDMTYYGPSYFKLNYDVEWLEDPFVQDMIQDVDHSTYAGGRLIQSDVLGPISPLELSGGVQTLICILKCPDMVFDATSCGQNCAKWLIEIGKKQDVTISLEYYMSFKDMEPFKIMIENTHVMVTTDNEYYLPALELLQEVQ
ncbi:MAG: DUF4869 domain-containing protein [Eubacterium sp.]|nr:DUF4869 domain-containing protein [Eubacterium sp.]